jgi:hypothetical protein
MNSRAGRTRALGLKLLGVGLAAAFVATSLAATAQQYHGSTTRTQYGSTRLRSSSFVLSVSSYHTSRYGAGVDARYASHPSYYGGAQWASSGGGRWYNGYWHRYWGNQDWLWWNSHYGFWLDLNGINVFVYESAPGDCQLWNGYAWISWYDPPFTPYGCPY